MYFGQVHEWHLDYNSYVPNFQEFEIDRLCEVLFLLRKIQWHLNRLQDFAQSIISKSLEFVHLNRTQNLAKSVNLEFLEVSALQNSKSTGDDDYKNTLTFFRSKKSIDTWTA